MPSPNGIHSTDAKIQSGEEEEEEEEEASHTQSTRPKFPFCSYYHRMFFPAHPSHLISSRL